MSRDRYRDSGEVRCAIYTRKSTEEGLDQDFNTLDAQRDSGEAYVASMKHEGWTCVPDRYDDGGYTGGNMDRPALTRLLADIESGKVNCVVVYKVDRLSRSLLDFARIMQVFDDRGVSFVSVTQRFDTSSSMGRLMLNVLLSFAQFEREIISERTRDKMAAARRKGKYVGGRPILGYDVCACRLVVNEVEAERVRKIFALYAEHGALLATVRELDRLGWRTKVWTTKRGKRRGGSALGKTNLHALLTNVTYIGKIRHKDVIYEGEHDGIVDPDLFEKVQKLLRRNLRTGGAASRNQFGALLKGLLHCGPCSCSMAHSHSTRNGNKRYRYYVCTNAQKHGWHKCPSKSLPAGEIERFVIDQVRMLAADPTLIAGTMEETQRQTQEAIAALDREYMILQSDVSQAALTTRELAIASSGRDEVTAGKLTDLQERIHRDEIRLAEIARERESLHRELVSEEEVADALNKFEPLWNELSQREQGRVLQLLIERVEYDGTDGDVSITFRPSGFRQAVDEMLTEEVAA